MLAVPLWSWMLLVSSIVTQMCDAPWSLWWTLMDQCLYLRFFDSITDLNHKAKSTYMGLPLLFRQGID